MVDTNFNGEWLSGPLLCADNVNKTLVHAGHCFYHASWGMVVLVLQGAMNVVVMHTPKTFTRSSQQTARELCLCRASSMMERSFMWCSVHPETLSTKAF